MTLEERINFCRECEHKGFSPHHGIFCRLTGEKPDFEESCEFFTGDRQKVEKLISEKKEREIKHEDLIKTGAKFSITQLLIPGKKYLFTPLIFYSLIIIYISMVLSGTNPFFVDIDSLTKWGGNYKISTYYGEYWRLITALFLHGGIVHLVANLYAFLIVAILLEPLIGKWRFGIAFLLTGIAASLTSLWRNPALISVGASGAVFGLFGIYVALLTTSAVSKKTRIIVLPGMIIYIVFNLLSGMVNPIVDNHAHIGGFLSGLIMGYVLLPAIKNPEDNVKNNMRIISVAAGVVVYAVIAFQGAKPVIRYQQYMKRFSEVERIALNFYRLPEDASSNDALYMLEHDGIKNWSVCLNITYKIDLIDNLPQTLYNKNELVRQYVKKQQIIYHFLKLKILKNTYRYDDLIRNNIKELNAILLKLNAMGFSAGRAMKIAEHAQKEQGGFAPYNDY